MLVMCVCWIVFAGLLVVYPVRSFLLLSKDTLENDCVEAVLMGAGKKGRE